MSRRDWTEAEARAWLKASLPKGWHSDIDIEFTPTRKRPHVRVWVAYVCKGALVVFDATLKDHLTLRAACRGIVQAAKRAGMNINAAPEPQGGGK